MTWDDITVKQFIEISKLGETDLTDLKSMMNVFSIVYNLDISEVKKLNMKEAAKMKKEVDVLLSTLPSDDKLTNEFEVDGVKFEFCDLQNDWIFAKNIDLENMSKDIKNFAICLAILYYPKGEEYETMKAIKYSKLIENQSIEKLYSAWYFFFLITMSSVEITQNYSVMDMMTEGTKVMMRTMEEPEKLLPILKRLLWKKLKASGTLTVSSINSLVAELNNGSTS